MRIMILVQTWILHVVEDNVQAWETVNIFDCIVGDVQAIRNQPIANLIGPLRKVIYLKSGFTSSTVEKDSN